jgi:hypothetical protein
MKLSLYINTGLIIEMSIYVEKQLYLATLALNGGDRTFIDIEHN